MTVSENILSIALSKQGDLIASNSSGDLLKVNPTNGDVYWTLNTLGSMLAHATDFFKSSDIVIINALDSDNLNLRSSWRENF